MAFTVEQLIEGHQEPVTACPYYTAQQALELMIEHDFSQLPVVDDNNKPLGVVTGDSILRALNNFGIQLSDLQVLHAIVKVDQYSPDEDLFDLLDDLKNTYAVLIVHNDGTLKSIVTSYDTTEYFRRRAEDMMYVEDIESTVKDFIRTAFNSTDNIDQPAFAGAIAEIASSDLHKKFQNALNNYLSSLDKGKVTINQDVLEEVFTRHFVSKDVVRSFDDLTLNEYIQLILHKNKWPSFGSVFSLPSEAVRNLLNGVRKTRNDLAHFHGEITSKQRDQLHFCVDWLERHRSDVLAAFRVNSSTPEMHAGAAALEITYTIAEPISDEISPIEEELSSNDSRYAPLALWLQSKPFEEKSVTLSFIAIEKIIGDKLPASARKHRAWWSNHLEFNPQARQWWDAGWRVFTVRIAEEVVVFTRIEDRQGAYINFFNALLTQLSGTSSYPVKIPEPKGESYLIIARLPKNGAKIVSLAFSFARRKRFRVELYIDSGDEARNKDIFEALHQYKNVIESELGTPVSWERLEGVRSSRIAIYHNGTITDGDDELANLRAWAVDAMVRFQKVMDKHLSEVL